MQTKHLLTGAIEQMNSFLHNKWKHEYNKWTQRFSQAWSLILLIHPHKYSTMHLTMHVC